MAWFVERMEGQTGVGLVVPHGFEAVLRLMHRPDDGTWADRAPGYLRHGASDYVYPFPAELAVREGDLGEGVIDVLVPVLAKATSTPASCHYGLWVGWGEFNRGAHTTLYTDLRPKGPLEQWRQARQRRRFDQTVHRIEEPMYAVLAECAVQPWWGGRDMRLFDGPIEAVASIGSPNRSLRDIRRRGPQWWWPRDRSWFVGSEIDHPWSYLAGRTGLIEVVHADPRIETVVVNVGDAW